MGSSVQATIQGGGGTSLVPIGTIIPVAYRTPDSGFLSCDGTAISRTTYSTLFTKIVPLVGTCSITNATPAVITLASHGFATGDSIYLTTTGALPTGLSIDTIYYVVYINATTFSLATTYANAIAGTKIATSSNGSGTHSLYHCPYGLGNGSTTFNLPDLKGAHIRGAGLSTAFTADVTIVGGQVIDDQMQGHYHSYYTMQAGSLTIPTSSTLYQRLTEQTGAGGLIGSPITDGTNGTPRTGTETAVKAIGVYYQIKVL